MFIVEELIQNSVVAEAIDKNDIFLHEFKYTWLYFLIKIGAEKRRFDLFKIIRFHLLLHKNGLRNYTLYNFKHYIVMR